MILEQIDYSTDSGEAVLISTPWQLRLYDPAWHQMILNYAASCHPEKSDAAEFLKFLSTFRPVLWSYESPLSAKGICFIYPKFYTGNMNTVEKLIETAGKLTPVSFRILNADIEPIGGIYMCPSKAGGTSEAVLKNIPCSCYENMICSKKVRANITDYITTLDEYSYYGKNDEQSEMRGESIKYRISADFELPLHFVTYFTDLIHKSLSKSLFKNKDNINDDFVKTLTGYSPAENQCEQNNSHIHIFPVLAGNSAICGFIIWHRKMFSERIRYFLKRKFTIRSHFGNFYLLPLDTTCFEENITYFGRLIQSIGRARIWHTLTPFVPPRYVKTGGHNTLEGQILKELKDFGIEEKVEQITITKMDDCDINLYRGMRKPKQYVKFHVEIVFSQEIYGPLLLGYGSHYGLGMFVRDTPKHKTADSDPF